MAAGGLAVGVPRLRDAAAEHGREDRRRLGERAGLDRAERGSERVDPVQDPGWWGRRLVGGPREPGPDPSPAGFAPDRPTLRERTALASPTLFQAVQPLERLFEPAQFVKFQVPGQGGLPLAEVEPGFLQ